MSLELGDGADVQVVRRLVEQQDVGPGDERAGEQHAPLHAAGQRRHVRVGLERQLRERLLDARGERPAVDGVDPVLEAAEPGGDVLAGGQLGERVVVVGQELSGLGEPRGDRCVDGALEVGGHGLGERGHAQVVLADDLAAVGGERPRDELEQRRLALAVPADERDALAALERHVDAVEQGLGAEGDVHVAESDQAHARMIAHPGVARRAARDRQPVGGVSARLAPPGRGGPPARLALSGAAPSPAARAPRAWRAWS